MGKILNIFKKYSFGVFRTGLYSNGTFAFGSVLSLILSIIFLLGLLTGITLYFNEIFIQRHLHIVNEENQLFSQSGLATYNLPQALAIFPNVTLFIALSKDENKTCNDLSLYYYCHQKYQYVKLEDFNNDICLINLYQNK